MPANILHLHSSFDPGGAQVRAVRLMNAFGGAARHMIVSDAPDQLGARASIAKSVKYEIAQNPPPLAGKPSVARYEALARYMRRFDLVLTYGWGAIDGVMARRVFGKDAPPLVHHEDGFNADEAGGLKRERTIYRRLALPAADALVVPSQSLEKIALETWRQPLARVHRIATGIPTALYANKPDPRAIPGFVPDAKEVVIGAIAGLLKVKNLPELVRSVGGVSGRIRLVIVGEGPERAAIVRAAEAMGIADRLVMPGFVHQPHRYIGLFDILALSSLSEQFPRAVIEGMAAGLPIVSPAVGDVPRMVAPENAPFIADRADEVRLRDCLQSLASDADLRRRVGSANRSRAFAEFDEGVMIARYRTLYEQALGRPGGLT